MVRKGKRVPREKYNRSSASLRLVANGAGEVAAEGVAKFLSDLQTTVSQGDRPACTEETMNDAVEALVRAAQTDTS